MLFETVYVCCYSGATLEGRWVEASNEKEASTKLGYVDSFQEELTGEVKESPKAE